MRGSAIPLALFALCVSTSRATSDTIQTVDSIASEMDEIEIRSVEPLITALGDALPFDAFVADQIIFEAKSEYAPSDRSLASLEETSVAEVRKNSFQSTFQGYMAYVRSVLDDDESDITDIFEHSLLNKTLLFLMMFLLGRSIVHVIRARFKDQPPWKVNVLPLLTPMTVYSSFLYFLSKSIAEISSFGILIGILSRLSVGSAKTESKGYKLIVRDSGLGTEMCTIWADDVGATVSEIKDKIAAELDITPSIRVCIESGRGHFIDQTSAPLLPLISNVVAATDLFGVLTATVRVAISEVIESRSERPLVEKSQSTFFHMLNSKEGIKFGSDLLLHARVKSSVIDLVTFSISSVNGFAACAPHHQFPIPNSGTTIQLHPWASLASPESSPSLQSPNPMPRRSVPPLAAPSGLRRIPSKNKNELAARSFVRDGDEVMVECEGNYLSVAKGWWLAWSSPQPRRSGAFTIEITEKASVNRLQETIFNGISKLKETINGKQSVDESANKNDILCNGDSFRLRSLKFPDYELGVTSVKIKDNFCYLGLRKVLDFITSPSQRVYVEMLCR